MARASGSAAPAGCTVASHRAAMHVARPCARRPLRGRYLVVQTTGEGKTVDEVSWVEINDPSHRLYGFRLPLVRTLTHPRRGRLCVVRLYPGLDCYVPLAATSLVDKARCPPSCRVSVMAIERLVRAVGSMAATSEECRATNTTPGSSSAAHRAATCVTTVGDDGGAIATTPGPHDSTSVSVAQSCADAVRTGAAGGSASRHCRAPGGSEG